MTTKIYMRVEEGAEFDVAVQAYVAGNDATIGFNRLLTTEEQEFHLHSAQSLDVYEKEKPKDLGVDLAGRADVTAIDGEVIRPPREPGTDNFQLWEFQCSDGNNVPPALWANVQDLMDQLEVIRKRMGAYPLTINSGYRTKAYNDSLPDASPVSQHLYAKAADIAHPSPTILFNAIESLIESGSIHQGGLGLYSWGCHYDTRGHKARW